MHLQDAGRKRAEPAGQAVEAAGAYELAAELLQERGGLLVRFGFEEVVDGCLVPALAGTGGRATVQGLPALR